MGIITDRQKRRRTRQRIKSMTRYLAAATVITAVALAPQVHLGITRVAQDAQVFSRQAQTEMTLPEYDVYALQLAVFDSGERAEAERQRLHHQGVCSVVFQGERMRIVCDAAFTREALQSRAAKGNEAYVIRDTLPSVSLRLSADGMGVALAKRLLETPDALLRAILETPDSAIRDIAKQAAQIADESLGAYPENTLYTQLAQSLNNWSRLMLKTLEEKDENDARSYGAATMCLLCRQLRQALMAQSTASAQRTPSTAADVMPPA